MRIRSIRPEFWTSEDIAALDWETRLIFIGLWSYVDDNGVGRDVEKLIKADLLALEDDPHKALMQITRALMQLKTGGQICRYEVEGKPLLHICAWASNQIISRPSKGRYTHLTCEDAAKSPNTHVKDMSPHANAPLGEGEKGRRGEGEKGRSIALRAKVPANANRSFELFWDAYGKKVGKGAAERAFAKAAKTTDPAVIIDAADEHRAWHSRASTEARFIPHPATWLNEKRWTDERPEPTANKADGDIDWDAAMQRARARDERNAG